MAFPAIIALAGGAAATASLVLAAVVEVGVTLSVVGVVTGNKDLMKIGGVMSLVGGIGGMVAGASGAAASSTSALTEAGTEAALESASAEAMGAYGGSAAAEASQQAAISGMEGVASEGIVGNAAQTMGAGPNMASPVEAIQPSAPLETPTAQAAMPDATTVADATNVAAPEAPIGAQTPAEVSTPYSNPTDARLAAGNQHTPWMDGAPKDSAGFFDGFFKFAKDNEKLLNSGVQFAGGALKGMNESAMWDEKMELERTRQRYGNSAGSFAPSANRGIVAGARA